MGRKGEKDKGREVWGEGCKEGSREGGKGRGRKGRKGY